MDSVVIVYDFGGAPRRRNAPGAGAVRLHFVLGRIMQSVMIQCTYDTEWNRIDGAARALYTHPPPPSYVTYETAVEFQITVHKSIHTHTHTHFPVHPSLCVPHRVFTACNNKVQKCGITLRFIGYRGSRYRYSYSMLMIYRGIDYFRIKLFARGRTDSTRRNEGVLIG